MDIGFLGLGAMGSPMARNLVKAGHHVTVWNRSRPRAEALAGEGARLAATPAEAAACPLIITMLADDAAVEAVASGPQGLETSMPEGGIHVSMSTISVALSDRLGALHAKAGQGYVAAPVFGRPDMAQAAKLFVVAAGEEASIERARPAIDALGQRLFVVGRKPSQANLVKLAGNFLITCVIESLAEAFALTAKGGIDCRKVHEVLTETLFSAPIYRTYGEIILEGRFTPPGFRMPLGLKDNRLLQEAAEQLAVPLPVAALVRDRFLSAIAHGDAERDWSAIALRAAEDAGIKP